MASLRNRLARLIAGAPEPAASRLIAADLRGEEGWTGLGDDRGHDRPADELQAHYADTLAAWRHNPMAWRIIQITTDYTVGEGLELSSPHPDLQRFLEAFWHHPENRLNLRLDAMADELARAGDLFPLLFRQRQDGVSVLRFLTKDQILRVATDELDWECEVLLVQRGADPTAPKEWPMAGHPRQQDEPAVALHYAVNRPLGATFGESDLATVLPWLLRYSRMLEDRVRFHWATRMFLWFVRVPTNKVAAKAEQYRHPPESGSIVVHDDAESWEAKSPVVRGADAAPDLKAVRSMIDAGSGYPPHWRGEATDVNLATAQAMQEPAERHLARRQHYFAWVLQDLVYQAYQRAHAARPALWPALPTSDYRQLFTVARPDVSRADNLVLAQATRHLAEAFATLTGQLGDSPTLRRLLLEMTLRFAGQPGDEGTIAKILEEGDR